MHLRIVLLQLAEIPYAVSTEAAYVEIRWPRGHATRLLPFYVCCPLSMYNIHKLTHQVVSHILMTVYYQFDAFVSHDVRVSLILTSLIRRGSVISETLYTCVSGTLYISRSGCLCRHFDVPNSPSLYESTYLLVVMHSTKRGKPPQHLDSKRDSDFRRGVRPYVLCQID